MLASQPSPASSPGKKMHHFGILFSSKMAGERKIMVFQNRTNKIGFGPKICGERIKSTEVRLGPEMFHVRSGSGQAAHKEEIEVRSGAFWC